MEFTTVEQRQRVGLVTFRRPEVMNAWSRAMRHEIAAACAALEHDPAVGAVVLTGGGDRAFGAGQDLREPGPDSAEAAAAWVAEWRTLLSALRGLSKPTVAAVNGVAAGSSFQFALLADFRVGHPGVRMGQPEVNAGVASSMGPLAIHAVLGHDLALTGRMMDGKECIHHGLLSRVVSREEVLLQTTGRAAMG